MNTEQLKIKIQEIAPKAEIKEAEFLSVSVLANELLEVAQKLKTDTLLRLDYMTNLTGVDYGDALGVVYHLSSTEYKHIVVLKVRAEDRQNPVLESLSGIWKTAEFHEREVYDLLGIKFNNHPYLKRIFLEDDWVGHPLRKDYTDPNMLVKK